MSQWYYREDGQELGPADDQLLRALIAVGSVKRSTLVRRASQSIWVCADRTPLAVLWSAFGGAASTDLADGANDSEDSGRSDDIAQARVSSLSFFSSYLIALVCIYVLYALLGSAIIVNLLLYDLQFEHSFSGNLHVPLPEMPEFLRYAIANILYALMVMAFWIVGNIDTSATILSLLTIGCYLFWIYVISRRLAAAGVRSSAAQPWKAIAWNLVPPMSLYFPRRMMLEFYQIAEEQSGDLDVKPPRALSLWWGCMLYVYGFFFLCFILILIPKGFLYILHGAVDYYGTFYYPTRYLFLIMAIILLWVLPLGLGAFLWLQRHVSGRLLPKVARTRKEKGGKSD